MELDGSIKEVGLLEFFENAQMYLRLAGENRPQDFAILRLLLAILHATFGRQEDGTFISIDGEGSEYLRELDDLIDRWVSLWNRDRFPFASIKIYLEKYRERFWLVHPERPFYQIPAQNPIRNNGTYCGAQKLQGTLSESGNKTRLFSHRAKEEKNSLEMAEAARWLVYQIAFDDTAAKPVTKGRPGPGVGWLGKLGLIAATGDNLFQTLLLNLVFLPDGEKKWDIERPIWAKNELSWSERTPIPVPQNASEILTLQSRWIHLDVEGDKVNGFYVMGGFFYEKNQELFNEQMTLWRKRKNVKQGEQVFTPKLHNASRALWRDLSTLLVAKESSRKAGVVAWVERLRSEDVDIASEINFEIAAVSYKGGSPSNDVVDSFHDGLSFSTILLDKHSESWRERILDEVEWTDKLVWSVKKLARDLTIAGGGSGDTLQQEADTAASVAYFRLDIPFRSWLEGINPSRDDLDEKMQIWREEARKIIWVLGGEMVSNSGTNALVGRFVTNNKTKEEYLYNSPRAFESFRYNIYQN